MCIGSNYKQTVFRHFNLFSFQIFFFSCHSTMISSSQAKLHKSPFLNQSRLRRNRSIRLFRILRQHFLTNSRRHQSRRHHLLLRPFLSNPKTNLITPILHLNLQTCDQSSINRLFQSLLLKQVSPVLNVLLLLLLRRRRLLYLHSVSRLLHHLLPLLLRIWLKITTTQTPNKINKMIPLHQT